MKNQLSMAATAALLVAASIQSADARSVSAFVHSSGCSAGAVASELRDGHGSCQRVSAAPERVRIVRSSRSHASHVARGSAGCGGRLSSVRSASGAVACVTSRAASAFQGFVSALEATGYRIDFMGGWRAHGSCRQCDMHPRGLAIDINQTGRNRVTHRFPAGVTELAAHYGLLHGAIWDHPDTGHFELMSESPTRWMYEARITAYASADGAGRRHSRRYAAALAAAQLLARAYLSALVSGVKTRCHAQAAAPPLPYRRFIHSSSGMTSGASPYLRVQLSIAHSRPVWISVKTAVA